jgi:CBS domain-containing protein
MTVASILRSKGRDVLTVEPRQTLRDVVALLAARGVGAVVVSNPSREVLGILSERDIVRALGREGVPALDAPVTKHMTQKVFTVGESASIAEVMERMTDGRFRHAPVVENGRLVGIVSIGDVVKRQIDDLDHEREDLKAYIATA